jgi:uncharacterized protein YndB with AHSA1/START domain
MAAGSSAAPRTADRELVISRTFDAPRATVFKAWTEKEQLASWWGPQGFVIESCEADLRPGGAWRLAMRSPEGTLHTNRGVYREIVPPERLVLTYAWEDARGTPGHETLVTVTFAEQGKRTRMVLHQAIFESPTSCEAHRTGWTSCFERFSGYLAERG